MRGGLSIDPPLGSIPALLTQEGVDVYQTVLRDPGRFGNYGVPEPADRAPLVEGLPGRRTGGLAHGSLLVNLASPEGRIRNSSVSSLLADLKVAAEVGVEAVCFHVGYAKGHPSPDAALTLATRKLGELIGKMPAGAGRAARPSGGGPGGPATSARPPTASPCSSTPAPCTPPASISRARTRAGASPTRWPRKACWSGWSPFTSTIASFPAAPTATATLPRAPAPSAWAWSRWPPTRPS